MNKSKNSNWLLIGALMFFLVSAGFTTTTTTNTNQSATMEACGYVCDYFGCAPAEGSQVGASKCDTNYGTIPIQCNLYGGICTPGFEE